MEKARKKIVKQLVKKIGTSYPENVKQKIVGEIKSGFHSHRTAAKIYGISRNTINNWVTQDSLFSLTAIISTQRQIDLHLDRLL